jgi:hypothetical protein
MTDLVPIRQTSTWSLVEIPTAIDARGSLCFAESGRHVPFAIERVYWVHGVPRQSRRGHHAHLSVQELVVAAAGAFTVHLDNGISRDTVRLDDPSCGLLVDAGVWRELDSFSPGALCLVLASGAYEEDEYVRDYATFAELAQTRRFTLPTALEPPAARRTTNRRSARRRGP